MGPVKNNCSENENGDLHKLRWGEPIPKDELLELVKRNYSGMDIADHFGCSKGKVTRTLKAMDISPHGYKYKNVGVEIHREKTKDKFKPHALRRVLRVDYFSKDVLELNSADNVLAPLSLTEFGVCDKLSKWGFWVHGAIDVYSRYILYMEPSASNDAATVLSHFRKGVEAKGLPVAVRCDPNDEIAGVVEFMDLNRPNGVDKIKNPDGWRMNRLRHVWIDVLRLCLQPFKAAFKELEERKKLDCNDPVDTYCLHQCYMHLMKAALEKFSFDWNHHNIKVAGNMSPTHLQFVGKHNLQRRAGLEGIHFPELDEKQIIEVDSDHEWPPTSHPSIHRRVLKKKKDRAELREQFPEESITFESAPGTFRKMRRMVKKIVSKS